MRLPEFTQPEFTQTATFRLATVFSFTFAAFTLLLFAFIYWQTAIFETQQIDTFIMRQGRSVAQELVSGQLTSVASLIDKDRHRAAYAGLFAADGTRIDGNLAEFPNDLRMDGLAHRLDVARLDEQGVSPETVRAIARRLSDGRLLVIGRDMEDLDRLRDVVLRALELGVIPLVALSLVAGIFLSLRAQQRVKAVHRTVARIMQGDLRERLPIRGTKDDFDRLATSVNDMLDEIERLMDEIKGVGDDIAHDLRTPLTRVRMHLERGSQGNAEPDKLRHTIDRAIAGLDQALRVITALLRIGEIEGGRRRAGFSDLDPAALVQEIGELFEPIAETRQIQMTVDAPPMPALHGDRDLLFEALANLVDNALKFTPEGGTVRLFVADRAGLVLGVTDNGPGIAPEEAESVLKRFYRSDKSRHLEGAGLGLSLVMAIVKLHDFTFHIRNGAPGCISEIICRPSGNTASR